MRMNTARVTAATMALLCTAALSACNTRAPDATSQGSEGAVKTDHGVTDDTITLGVLSDFSVVYGPLAKTVYAGNKIWADEVNAKGGICGRQIKFVVKDQKMDTQLANTQYAGMKDNVLGIVQLLGSPVISSLLPQIKADHMPTMAHGWSEEYLGTPELTFVGTPYALDMINGVQYLQDERMVKKGDTIGHIYMAGDFGENGAAGAKHAADELGLKYVGKKIDPTAASVSAEMASLKAADVSAILISTGPKQTAMVASQTPSMGLDVPILVNAPSYDPSFLSGPVAQEVLDNLLVVTAQAAFTGDLPVQKKLTEAYPDVADENLAPTHHVLGGYATGRALEQALTAACDAGDLTRESVVKHLREVKSLDTDGAFPPQNFTDPSQPGSNESRILKPRDNPGGLIQIKEYFASPLQDTY